MLLHAWRLRFAHPLSGNPMLIEAPLDQEYTNLLERFDWPRPPFDESTFASTSYPDAG
jgi:tRNA pseudouridine65 synthase